MSNLGLYQTIVTVIKKVGGPKKFIALASIGGYAVWRPVEAGIKKIIKSIKDKKNTKEGYYQKYVVTKHYEDQHGLILDPGDTVRVILEVESGVLLVEKIGDASNPYCMAPEDLMEVSDYQPKP